MQCIHVILLRLKVHKYKYEISLTCERFELCPDYNIVYNLQKRYSNSYTNLSKFTKTAIRVIKESVDSD